MSDYVTKSEWRMRLEDIGSFIDVKNIEPRLRKIFGSSEFTKYNDKEQLGVKIFLDVFDGKIKNRF